MSNPRQAPVPGPVFPCSGLLAVFLAGLLGAPAAQAGSTSEWTEERPSDLSHFVLKAVEFEGNFHVSEDELRSVIRSSTSNLLHRYRPVNLERIEGDVVRLRQHLRRKGYWNATVTRRVLFDHKNRGTKALFHIEEGVQRIVGGVRVLGQQFFAEGEILSWTELRPGEPFDLTRADRDRAAIEDAYADRGFYRVRVIADVQPSTRLPEGVLRHDLVFRVEEGPRFFVGTIRVEGNRFTDGEIIRRELAIETGGVLSRDRVAESRSRLYATGFFSRVELLPQNLDSSTGPVDVLVRVVERKMRFVGAGVGYGTRDQLRISGEWGHRNLWGRGERASVRGILATELFPGDLVRTRLEGRFVEPRFLGSRTIATTELFYERRRELFTQAGASGEYDLNLVGLVVNLNRRFTRHTSTWVTLENEWADLDAEPGTTPPDGSRPEITRTISLTLERDRRDYYLDPKRGFFNRVLGSVAGGVLGGDNDFWKTQVESSWLRTMRGVTLAGRVRLGYARPFGRSAEVPDRERFKLGGATTVRGYAEQEIGPGDFLILGNFEVRLPLFWLLGLGVFLDGGHAWEHPSEVRLKDFRLTRAKRDPARAAETDFRYALGAGIRLASPVGPVRFDYGRKLKILPVLAGESQEEKWRIHLSLGHVF